MVLRPGPCVLCFQSAPKKKPRGLCGASSQRGNGLVIETLHYSRVTYGPQQLPAIAVRLAPSGGLTLTQPTFLPER